MDEAKANGMPLRNWPLFCDLFHFSKHADETSATHGDETVVGVEILPGYASGVVPSSSNRIAFVIHRPGITNAAESPAPGYAPACEPQSESTIPH